MPRTKRLFSDFGFYHVVNRGNERKQVFYSLADYRAFLSWVKEFKGIFDIHVIAYCLMPNHFHLLLSPKVGQNLSKFMHRLMTKQIPNFRKLHNSIGHIWQGRYKPFPVQKDSHLITAMRYIERNPVRANLVENAKDWHWSSHRERLGMKGPGLLSDPPFKLHADWEELVNTPLTTAELEEIQHSVRRGTPYGDPIWQEKCAQELNLEHTLRPPGRPKKKMVTGPISE